MSDQPEIPQVFQLLLHDGLLEDVIGAAATLGTLGRRAARVRSNTDGDLLHVGRTAPYGSGGRG